MLADPFLFERPALKPAAMPPGASRNQG
jgi:hypothetical protein